MDDNEGGAHARRPQRVRANERLGLSLCEALSSSTNPTSLCVPSRGRRRPYLASECKSLPDAERWRREILREVTKKVSEIQNGERGGVGALVPGRDCAAVPRATPARRFLALPLLQRAWARRASAT
jgi:hypothetical protein